MRIPSLPARRIADRSAAAFAARLSACLLAAGVATGLLAPSAARADMDYTFGGDARAFAMAGAGLALMRDSGGATRYNPASLAFESKPVSVYVPSVGLRTEDIDLGDVVNYFASGFDGDEAGDIARAFAQKDSSFGINANLGLRIGHFEVTAGTVGRGRLQPNESLRDWANGPDRDNVAAMPLDAQADILAAGYYTLPSVAFATAIPSKDDDRSHNIAVGVRVRAMRAFYTHYLANYDTLRAGDPAMRAPEMGDEDYQDKTGMGADLGFLMQPRKSGGVSAALVASNLIKPDFKFRGTDRDGNPIEYDLLATTFSAGVGYQKGKLTLAADLIDITSEADDAQLRLGAEQRLGPIAVRGGYNSATGYTYGFGVFGFDVAFGENQPLELVRTLRF